MTYEEFSELPSSSKLVLCHVEPVQRVAVFSLDTGSTYKRDVNHFVVNVSEDGSPLTEASSSTLTSGQWFYDSLTGQIYVRSTDDSDPRTKKIVLTYRLFFASKPVDLPYDLVSGETVHYEGRLKANSPIKKELDDEQVGIVLESATNLSFDNNDGFFEDIYDVLIFENKNVKMYSWSELINLSEKRKLFDGQIQNKSYSNVLVKFSCKDFSYKLREPVSHETFKLSDGNIPERYLYTPKRRLFGQFKQLQCVPIDSTLDGFDLTGSMSGSALSATITGSGTLFLSELSPEDELILITVTETKKFSVLTIASNTSLTLSEDLEENVSSSDFIVNPIRPYRLKNRRWHIAGHKLREPSTTVSASTQANRFTVNDASDLFANDLIDIDGEDAFIKRLSGNDITLTANLQSGIPSVSDSVTKNPVSKAYINGSEIFITRDWLLTNSSTNAILEIEDLAEFNVATSLNIANNLSFTNGSRTVTTTAVDLRAEVKTRDWIRSQDASHTTWYEVLEVKEASLTLRTNYGGANITSNANKKNVKLIDDAAVITVNCIGQERSSAWVKTASDAVKDLLVNDALITDIDAATFTEADADAPFIMSYAIPERIGGTVKTIKDAISDINESVFGSLVINNDFDLQYTILTPEKPTDLVALEDDDLTSTNITVNSKSNIVRKVNAKYSRYTDKFNGESAFELYEFENDFTDDLIGAKAELNIDVNLFNLDDVTTIAQRYGLYNSLSKSSITIKGKLNLALKVLNDKVYMQFDRLYRRFGNSDKRKIGIINKVINNGTDVTLEINDLGNNFNRVANISDDAASDFTSATNDEKIIYNYVTDDDTLTPDASSDLEIYSNSIG